MVKYVIGHKNPDTDSVCAAIVYSSFLNSCGDKAEPFVLGILNNETRFIFDRLGVISPGFIESLDKGSDVVLVDHNEKKQTIDNIDELNIVEIIDHHKFLIDIPSPLFIRAEALGSTCTIVAKMMFEKGVEISCEDAVLLVSAIISDTLYFRSPTTTKDDRDIVARLNEIAKIDDLEKYSLEMFAAKSNLGDIDVLSLVKLDYKTFDFNGKSYGVGVMETTSPEYGLKRKDEIVSCLKDVKKSDGLSGVMFSIIDILNEKNLTIFGDKEDGDLIVSLFDGEIVEDNVCDLGSLVSRKKQIIPVMEKSLK